MIGNVDEIIKMNDNVMELQQEINHYLMEEKANANIPFFTIIVQSDATIRSISTNYISETIAVDNTSYITSINSPCECSIAKIYNPTYGTSVNATIKCFFVNWSKQTTDYANNWFYIISL